MPRNTSGLRRGGGRIGPNKLTKSAREAFQLAFDGIGGAVKLEAWARKHPTEFYKLYARLIPVEHIGDPDKPIATTVKHVYETLEKRDG